MNFYPRYCGDYGRDTGHLTLAEHGAYTLLLDAYYSGESSLPDDINTLYRLCRAMDESERAAVQSVLGQFFMLNGDGRLHNKRADREIPIAKARIAIARENGKSGGRPKITQRDTQRQSSPSPSPSSSAEVKEKTKSDRNFVAPAVSQVQDYARSVGIRLDANHFCDFYASKGWVVGKTKMRDWQAAARGWAKRQQTTSPQGVKEWSI